MAISTASARPYAVRLGRKQNGDHRAFAATWASIRQIVPRAWIDALIQQAADRTRHWARTYGPPAYGWSGGKDSLALQIVMDAAGVQECALAITRLEYPAFLSWVAEWMPPGLTVVDRQQLDIHWLRAHPEMLFPPTAKVAARWFQLIQRAGCKAYIRETRCPLFLLGRRIADGNHPRWLMETKAGRWGAPILDWTHEDVMAACAYYGPPLPPIYDWPRGWAVGSGCWPARQWTDSEGHGWREVWQIDPQIVRGAAPYFPGAAACVESLAP